jgi:hypothetical protein
MMVEIDTHMKLIKQNQSEKKYHVRLNLLEKLSNK